MIATAVVLGGATLEGRLGHMVIRLAAIPVLAMAVWRMSNRRPSRSASLALLVMAAAIALPLVQLVPLPPWLWTRLPGRAAFVQLYAAAASATPWLPLTLTPDGTWNAELSLIPPAASFVGALTLGDAARWRVIVLVIALAVLSMALGVVQLLTGPESALRFYHFTNNTYGVGLFANRNHQAAMMLVVAPLAAALWRRQSARASPAILQFVWLLVIAAAAADAIVLNSRAGLILLGPVLSGSFALATIGRSFRSRRAIVISIAICATALAAITLATTNIKPGFLNRIATDERIAIAPNAAKAAGLYSPWGTGLGSFDAVYRSVEPMVQISGSYFNHAHNDFLELWLETGLIGPCLALMGVFWIAKAAIAAWRMPASRSADMARAASLVAGALVLHSTVDYPLRTASLAVLFGFACACLVPAAILTSGTAIDKQDP